MQDAFDDKACNVNFNVAYQTGKSSTTRIYVSKFFVDDCLTDLLLALSITMVVLRTQF